MKVIFEFDTDKENSDDHREYKTYAHAQDMYFAITDMIEYLRKELKYSNLEGEERKAFEKIQEELLGIINERGIMNIILP